MRLGPTERFRRGYTSAVSAQGIYFSGANFEQHAATSKGPAASRERIRQARAARRYRCITTAQKSPARGARAPASFLRIECVRHARARGRSRWPSLLTRSLRASDAADADGSATNAPHLSVPHVLAQDLSQVPAHAFQLCNGSLCSNPLGVVGSAELHAKPAAIRTVRLTNLNNRAAIN